MLPIKLDPHILWNFLSTNVIDVKGVNPPNVLFATPFDQISHNKSFCFVNSYSEEKIKKYSDSVIIIGSNSDKNIFVDGNNNLLIWIKDPRDTYFSILNEIHHTELEEGYTKHIDGYFYHKTSHISSDTKIGSGTVIRNNVVIHSNVEIGRNCIIQANTVIGNQGFGIIKDINGNNRMIQHYGGVIIGDSCNIGALNTVVSGTLAPTVLKDFVSTDDHVHIAHNVSVGKNVSIAASAEISGSVHICDSVWIGPNSSLKNGVSIGKNAFVGIGSNVVRNVDADTVVAGNPAREIK